ncbi:MAG: serine protein kinase RIO, partial [Candidatus ainarchaeum sp.]|nr:serine protein kinase RIO [Candidatus ainarchaeum sp.]
KGYFKTVEFVISTGKEAHVFRAVDASGNFRAVKIYKIETSDFKNMSKYLEGDVRFKKIKQNKRSLVFAWTRKEFKNLEALNKAGISVPLPIVSKNNVLIMEFIGQEGKAAKTIRENPVEAEKFFDFAVDALAKMLFRAELVHSDFSEYNVLNNNGGPVLIDCAQAVLTSHPGAKDFWERDLKNIANYLAKKGMKKTPAEIEEEVRKKKNNL